MSMTMGKEASLDGLEFDGDTVLCRVCGDKASGFHYGVHACEGCKGFFRRSIQQKIQYRPCLKNQQCNIMRVNRNRCQYCRLKKCIAVGMSRDAVRFGRVPKKEKARIIEQMQKSNLQMATSVMSSVMSQQDLVQSVILAYRQTSDLGQEKVKLMREIALLQNDYVDCPAHMACPLNSHVGQECNDNQESTDFSEFYVPAIRSVVDFAKMIPGFLLLNQDDQITLLKAATFEVLLVRMASLFDTDSGTMMFANGKLFRRQTSGLTTSVGFLLDSMFDFAERFNKLSLNDDEIALFSAVVLLSPDRPGLRQIDPVEKIQNKLTESLQNMINATHKEDNTLFAKLLMKTTDLRTLNALHAEKEVGAEKGEENVEMQESQVEIRSERSTPSDTSSSVATYTSGSTMDTSSIYDSNGSIGQGQNRLSTEGLSHAQQQVVLKTPYGTFYREDNTGYYGLVPEQPRRRCHTLDRDSQISRPRLHTIEEGSRRRYTMDREYISKMVGKLSDRLEKRAHVNSMPGSVNNSAASSPVPILEEQYALMNRNQDFIPISAPDSNASSTRTSPSFHKDLLQPFSSSPNSPRPRSGSMGTDDFGPQMRPRCSSFHMNSEGHAAQNRLYSNTDADFLSSPEGHHFRMTADMRRGSVGASHNLHARKKSLLVDRHPGYLSQIPDPMFRKFDKQRSPLATEDPSKGHHVGSGGSAFEQVPRLNIPPNALWTSSQLEPPKVSVTGPNDEHQTLIGQGLSGASLSKSPVGSARNSPELEVKNEDMYHKKFDKIRKHMALCGGHEETKQMEKLSIEDHEAMESEMSGEMAMTDSAEKLDNVKVKMEKSRKSAGEAHPQLLAQLTSGPQFKQLIQPPFPASSTSTSSTASQMCHQQSTILQQQLKLGTQNLPQNMSPFNGLEREKVEQHNGNVVLNVPQNMFSKVHPADMAAVSSMSGSLSNGSNPITGNHHHLENMLRKNPGNPIGDQQYLASCQPLVSSNNHSHLKEKLASRFPNTDSRIKYESDNDQTIQNGNVAGDFLPYHNGQQILPPGYQVRPVFESQTMMPQRMAYYSPMYGRQNNMATQFNQHLAGMQQMVYGNSQQPRQENSDVPLNLAQGHSEQQQQQQQQQQCPIKIKEEVIS